MKKNNFALLTFIAFLSIILILTVFAYAEENTEPLFTWNISKSEADSVVAKLYPHSESEGKYELIITGEGSMRTFSDFSSVPWLQYADSISSVTLEEQVKNLSNGVLEACIYLEELTVKNYQLAFSADAIPYTIRVYGHGTSTVRSIVYDNLPERFFFICRFEDSVCEACGYECQSHIGGEPNCNEFYKCEVCKAEYGNKKEHVLSQLIPEQPATCTADGMSAHYYCTLCYQFFNQSREPITKESLLISASHTFGAFNPYVAPTCTEFGIEAHYHCGTCGSDFDESKNPLPTVLIAATGHSGGYATCSQRAICDSCNRRYGNTDAENHVYSEFLKYDNEQHWLECECSSKKNVSSHTFTENILKQATESEEGIIEISCHCGYKTEKSIPVLEVPENPGNTDNESDNSDNSDNSHNEQTSDNMGYIIILSCSTLIIAVLAIIILIHKKEGKNNV